MQYEYSIDNGIFSFSVAGGVTAPESFELLEWRAPEINDQVMFTLIDLDNVDGVDSTGLSALIKIKKQFQARGVETVFSASPAVKEVFRITGLDHVFQVYTDSAEARAEIARRIEKKGFFSNQGLFGKG